MIEAQKQKDNMTAVAELNEWIEHVHDQTNLTELSLTPSSGCGIWQSVDNHYIRLLVGVDRPQTTREVMASTKTRGYLNTMLTQDHLEQAKQILDSFDLVLIREQL